VGKHFIGNERRVALLRMLHMWTLPPVFVLLLVMMMKSVFRFVAECAHLRQCTAGDDKDNDEEKRVALLRILAELWQGHCCRRANMK
jgi:hypothetical protein